MSRPNKYICIHGHFYQPPRENAWLETVEQQPSALPWHDWNERISFECYAPNAAARILDADRVISKIRNNYNRISFNFGPTLLSWMEENDPEAYKMLLAADIRSQEKFGGHGSAVAQVHSHLILPLANYRDKITQVYWGVRDFERRFGRHPEGIWLAETAVNIETLEVVAQHGIQYTILAPRQAKAIRKIGDPSWKPVFTETIDTRQPYWVNLPSGRRMALFFYNGQLAQSVAFEGVLNSGKLLASRLLSDFSNDNAPELVHVATDGESYGHHHRYGEMALVDCLNFIEEQNLAQLTNYGQFLELFPPKFEVEIHENSSWSCVHGIERWRSDCGCNSGKPGWHQRWRGPLRAALDWLRDQLSPLFEQQARPFLRDAWAARNEFIEVMLDRSEASVTAFFEKHARRKLSELEEVKTLRLLEMQRNAILMYTSCGWFFDEISGIETNQILQYAARAMDYAKQVGGADFQPEFTQKLALAPSNVMADGAESFRKNVLPGRVDLDRVGMHFAVSYLFSDKNVSKNGILEEITELFNFTARPEFLEKIVAGSMRLAAGRTTVRSKITHSEKQFSFAVLHLGQHNLIGNISTSMPRNTFDEMWTKLSHAFRASDLGEVLSLMQEFFGKEKFSLSSLFKDEKKRILSDISRESLQEADASFREIYRENYQLMSSLQEAELTVPEEFRTVVQYVLHTDLARFFQNTPLDTIELRRIADEMTRWKVIPSDTASYQLEASDRIFTEILKVEASDSSLIHIHQLISTLEILGQMNIKPDVWKSQNVFYFFIKPYKKGQLLFANQVWEKAIRRLGELLNVRI
jgi:alpha-amylase/alpha-mannosidase (GH57 family)